MSGSEYDVFLVALLIKLSLFEIIIFVFFKKAIQDGQAWHSAWLLAAPNCPHDGRTTSYLSPHCIILDRKKRLDCRSAKQVATRSRESTMAPRLGWYSLVLVGTRWYSLRSSGESGRNVSVSLLMSTLLKPSSLCVILSWEHFFIIKHEYGSIQHQYWRSIFFYRTRVRSLAMLVTHSLTD